MAVVESIKLCHSFQAPLEVDAAGINNAVTAYASGLPLEPRPELLGYNSGLLCIIIAMMLIVIFNIRQYSRFLKTLFNDMWSLRRRSTLFDERTVNETRIMGALIIQLCVCESILLLAGMPLLGLYVPPAKAAVVASAFIGVTFVYYFLQVVAYKVIGYVFAEPKQSDQLLSGFNSSQTLLGFCLLLPAMSVLFYPSLTEALLCTSILLYLCARIIFIYKGFRIFYHNFSTLLYFILYLCTVEIIPALLVLNGIFSLCRILIS